MTTYNIHTSNFSKLPENHENRAISIARGQPRYARIPLKYDILAPSWELLKSIKSGKISEYEYAVEYGKQLSKLNPQWVINDFYRLTEGRDPYILCHCGVNSFCHRHLVAEWLELSTGVIIPEYKMEGRVVRDTGRIVDVVRG